MISIFEVGIIIGLAILGYWLFKKVNLPAPAIMGPMLAVGCYQVLGGGLPELSLTIVNVFQIIIGLYLGAKINNQKLADIRKVLVPSLVIATWTLLSTIGMTLLILHFTPNIGTALFSAAPGGISEMTVLALAYHSEVAIVSTYQFIRVIVIVSVIPLLARGLKKLELHSEQKSESSSQVVQAEVAQKQELSSLLPLYGIGISGGLLLLTLNFPGGGVIGAMAALATANILLRKQYQFPPKIMQLALLGIGVSIGLEFSPEMAVMIRDMMLQIISFSFLVVLSNLVVGWYIRHITKWDTITSLLSSAPGGLTQMLVVGEEMKADTLTISVLQLVRLITIITSIPLIAPFLV